MDPQKPTPQNQSTPPQQIPGSIDDIKAKHTKHSKVLRILLIVCIVLFVIVLIAAIAVIVKNPNQILNPLTGKSSNSTSSSSTNGDNSSNSQNATGSNSNQVAQYTPEPISSSTANTIAPNLQNEILAAIAADQKKDPNSAKLVEVTPADSPGTTVVENWVVSFGSDKVAYTVTITPTGEQKAEFKFTKK